MAAVAVADAHAAEQHLLGRKFQQRADDLVHADPGHLRTGVEPVATRQKRQCMDIAPEVRPLAGPEPAIDGYEESHRRIEELVAALDLFEPSGAILASGAERAVELYAMLEASAGIGLPHLLGQGSILGLEGSPVLLLDCIGGLALDLLERLAGHCIYVPGLQIAVGGCTRRPHNQAADDVGIDRLVEKPATGDA